MFFADKKVLKEIEEKLDLVKLVSFIIFADVCE